MGAPDIEKFLAVDIGNLSDEEKEDLYGEIISFELPSQITVGNAVRLLSLSKEILKYKGDQVESLVLELDSLATRLGEEEAKRNHDLLNEVDDLRFQLSHFQGTGNDTKQSDDSDYRRRVVKMEIQTNQLISELQEKEQELMNEKKELEKLSTKLSALEDENKSLKNELSATQQELASSSSMKLLSDIEDQPSVEKYHELTELLRQKNRHITQLLNDIEEIEKENNILKEKLTIARDELAEGTQQMSKLSSERINLSTLVEELKEKLSKLELENSGLRNQIAELVADREARDKHLDNLKSTMDLKIHQFKEIIQNKDSEISALKLQIHSNSMNRGFDDSSRLAQFNNLSETLAQREEQILELQTQLKQATEDLNECTKLLEDQKEFYKMNFSEKNEDSNIIKQLKKKLEQAENRIAVLEAKVKHAEDESLKKAEEVSQLIIQLREYESGTYGLEDAVKRTRDLQKHIQVRDAQIEQLVQNSNQLQDELNIIEQENLILKEKLGIAPDEQIFIDGVSPRNRGEKQSKVLELSSQLETYHDELVNLKLENRRLNKLVSVMQDDLNASRISNSEKHIVVGNERSHEDKNQKPTLNASIQCSFEYDTTEQQVFDGQFQELVDENEGLRKGMHEILESIQHYDGNSTVQVKSETLDRLLEALDSRHVNGWYQPAMRLQAHIHHLTGINNALREELHMGRFKEEELRLELYDARSRIEQRAMKNESTTLVTIPERKAPSPKLKKTVSCSEELLTSHAELQKELISEKEKRETLQNEITQLHEANRMLEEQLRDVREQFESDKQSWLDVKSGMEKEITSLQNSISDYNTRINDFENTMEILKQEPDEMKRAVIESTLRLSSVKVEQQQLARKCQVLLETENSNRQEINKLLEEIFSLKQNKDQEILILKKNNDQLSLELKNHRLQSKETVKQSDYDFCVAELNGITVKYREILHKQILINSGEEKLIARQQNEISSYITQKTELETSLKLALEEIKVLTSIGNNISAEDQVSESTKEIAAMKLESINNKQQLDHINRMYELSKGQFVETETRCKYLEDRLNSMIKINAELQETETELRTKLSALPSLEEYEQMMKEFNDVKNNVMLLLAQKNEFEEVASIAQEQVQALERYNRYHDFEYDALHRRILELQSLSDDKMVIGRLTKELLMIQQNGMNSNDKLETYKHRISKLEAEVSQVRLKLGESELECSRLLQRDKDKMKILYAVIYELQKRYLGSLPLITEEIWNENIVRLKKECSDLVSLTINITPTLGSNFPDYDDNVQFSKRGVNASKQYISHEYKIKEFNLHLIIESLQNKLQIYAERLDRQDKLISRLEQEIIHADEQCQEFLLKWKTAEKIISEKSVDQEDDVSMHGDSRKSENLVQEPTDDLLDKLKHANYTITELRNRLKITEDELRTTMDKLTDVNENLKEKESLLTEKEKEILNLKTNKQTISSYLFNDSVEEEGSVETLALKATVDSLHSIVNQKEDTIKRLQNLIKESREEHVQNVFKLQQELKTLQEQMEYREQSNNRLKNKLEAIEKNPDESRSAIDNYLTRIHELEDELNQANERAEYLSNQLVDSKRQIELWSHTAEERLKTLQDMNQEMNIGHRHISEVSPDFNVTNSNILMQTIKDKSDEIQRQNQTIDELKKRLGSGEKLPGYRDRLKIEVERYKRRVDLLEKKEKEDKAEIQKLRNQLLNCQPNSSRRKELSFASKEEALIKKIKVLEEQVEEYSKKEQKWKENRKVKCEEEVEKWQNRKRNQQSIDRLRLQVNDYVSQIDSLKLSKERLKDTILRLEKERTALEIKLKSCKSTSSNTAIIDELQKVNSRLEEEVKILRKSSTLTAGATSLTDVIEAQERKITALEIAQKGDAALAEEIERLNERKSQLQNYNIRLEQENMQLKLEIDRLKSKYRSFNELSVDVPELNLSEETRTSDEFQIQSKDNKRRSSDLERAVLVLRRVVEKLQIENRKLHSNKVSQLQDKNIVEKLQIDLQNLQENYLDAIEKASSLDKELQNATNKNNELKKLITRLQDGEELVNLRSQLTQKNHLLTKVKILLEKAAAREKELNEKVDNLQRTNITVHRSNSNSSMNMT